MVTGMDAFRKAFQGYEDCYTIIGGTACDILMGQANLDFRATRDIDMILLIENRFEEFGKVFWEFIKKGEYRCGWKNSEKLHFYRFTEPQAPGFPAMIEIFSKDPGYRLHESGMVITPLHISDEVSSLSAIMLDDHYYEFMLNGRKVVDGAGVLGAEYLIPFKVRAWLDLCRRKREGGHVNSSDIKKHKNDVFRLMNIINPDETIPAPETVKEDLRQFIERMPEERINLKNIGLDMELDEALQVLKLVYGV